VPAVAGWKRGINQIALQEMIHLALVNNLLAALGGAPRLGRHNLPQRSPYAPEIRLTPGPVQRADAAAVPLHRAAGSPRREVANSTDAVLR
jgi:hypothetical protein